MKAVIVKAPGIVAVEVIPEPVVEDYDALCSVLASGICNGTDNNIVMNDPYHKVKFPAVLGHEGIGKVIAWGKKVRCLKIGDRITLISDILECYLFSQSNHFSESFMTQYCRKFYF